MNKSEELLNKYLPSDLVGESIEEKLGKLHNASLKAISEALNLSDVSKSFFAVVPKKGEKGIDDCLLLAPNKKMAKVLFKHWHYLNRLPNNKYEVVEIKAKNVC